MGKITDSFTNDDYLVDYSFNNGVISIKKDYPDYSEDIKLTEDEILMGFQNTNYGEYSFNFSLEQIETIYNLMKKLKEINN